MSPDSGGPRPLELFLVAGESSGDEIGAGLIQALRAARPNIVLRGVGGPAMETRGLASLFPMSDIAVMGFLPVIARLPTLLARISATVEAVVARPPDALVIIDSPDFTHRVARRVKKRLPALPIIDYVSPTVWAWRPGRAKAMRAYIDHVLALLPFEPAAHKRLGGPDCDYVGHPLIQRLDVLRPSAAEALARQDESAPTVLVLPGSRRFEIGYLMAPFGGAVEIVARAFPRADFVLPAVPHLAADIRARVAKWPVQPRVTTDEAEKFAAFRRARAALAASGTVTLELALADVPTVVGYRLSKIEEWILRRLVVAPSFILSNLVLGEIAIPGFIQEECNPEGLAASLLALLRDGPARDAQLAALARLDAIMRLPEGETPSGRAAKIVMARAENARPVPA